MGDRIDEDLGVIGREKTDKAFLEGLSMTNSSTNQQNAAIAVRQAAIDMNYSCADVKVFTDKFTAAGYTMPAIALRINCPGTQIVTADGAGNYTLPDFSNLANAINTNCNAVVTQSPVIGAVVGVGTHTITMTATSGTAVNCAFSVVVQPNLGVNDVEGGRGILVYPNPATNVLNIKGDFTSLEKISVFNMLGQKVLGGVVNGSETAVDISRLSNGVYTLYFESGKMSFKFVKQ